MSEYDPREPGRDSAERSADVESPGGLQSGASPDGETISHVAISGPPPPPPPAAPRKSGTGKIILALVFGGLAMTILFVFVAALAFSSRGEGSTVASLKRNKVAVVPIKGEIVSSSPAVEQLANFADNRSIRAIVVRINSPGGAVAPSQEIYEEIQRIRRETDKPVVASMESVAASGGYYIASACDHIVANPGTITGSIGVIAQWFNLEDLVRWAKLRPETIRAGEMKDAGSPFREMTDEERKYYERILSQLHEQFIEAVIEGRDGKLSAEEVRELADGRVFTGSEALDLKLVDQTGGLKQALRKAGELAGVSGEPTAVYPRVRRPGLLDVLAESREEASGLVRRILASEGSPFLYRW
jgi:protease IV